MILVSVLSVQNGTSIAKQKALIGRSVCSGDQIQKKVHLTLLLTNPAACNLTHLLETVDNPLWDCAFDLISYS